jgi:hypothetical protein
VNYVFTDPRERQDTRLGWQLQVSHTMPHGPIAFGLVGSIGPVDLVGRPPRPHGERRRSRLSRPQLATGADHPMARATVVSRSRRLRADRG